MLCARGAPILCITYLSSGVHSSLTLLTGLWVSTRTPNEPGDLPPYPNSLPKLMLCVVLGGRCVLVREACSGGWWREMVPFLRKEEHGVCVWGGPPSPSGPSSTREENAEAPKGKTQDFPRGVETESECVSTLTCQCVCHCGLWGVRLCDVTCRDQL